MIILTEKQRQAATLLGGDASNVMLYGGSRSGKTFVICWRLLHNAMTCPGSRQAVMRRHLNTAWNSIAEDTLLKVLELEGVTCKKYISEHKFVLENESEIWILGLDEKNRSDKVLGREFFTMYFNECSELSWESVQVAMTRCAMKIENDIFMRKRRNRIYFDCNPPSKRHWTYKAFVERMDPVRNTLWKDPTRWAYLKMNPEDNRINLSEEYISGVLGEYTGKMKQRFLDGIFSDDTENALWKREMIDPFRVLAAPDELQRIVVGVDPAVTDSAASDSTGIIVAGRKDDRYYVLDDLTVKCSPDRWAAAVQKAFERYQADRVVVEINNGGDLVPMTLRNTNRELPITSVHARRGKRLRAEPVAGIYEQGRVHHVGEFPELEDQMCSFIGDGTTTEKSPDHLDALVYALTELSGKTGMVTQLTDHFGVF